MIDEQHLREGLHRLLRDTETAIRERISDEPSIEAHLRERHAAAVQAGRTAGSASGYNSFADDAITQSGVHWLLGCVFVRFLEDNGWLDERNKVVAWLAGPGERLEIAKGERTRFLRPDPALTDRDYLLYVFGVVAKLPGMAGLFDPRHNPLFQLGPSAQGAEKIVEFFRRIDPDTGNLVHDFSDPKHTTRFLGDLYQNLSESARKRYALCQTPGFVVDFILDRTLTPAIDTFGLELVRMIDPACGSGHFLLAAFSRLFHLWQQREPATNPPALAQKALDAVHGVDLNTFAAEISRFRLLIAALKASGVTRLRDALDFSIHVAAGDSLLHGTRKSGGGIDRELFEDRLQFFYETEDAEEVKRILDQTYHVVVGNPPYINVSDPVLREAYRLRFSTCHGKYQLGIPFTERFFDLTVRSSDPKTGPAGWMGMIVSNAFMKRSFGKGLIESYLHRKDLTHVIDTSGVYLPGHGTPTTILIARNQEPVALVVRAVRGIRGETSEPEDPASAPVWMEISRHADSPGFEGEYVSVVDAPRESFSRHPWAVGGGGAAELKEAIDERAALTVGQEIRDAGRTTHTGLDDAFYFPIHAAKTRGLEPFCVPVVRGDDIGDYQIRVEEVTLFPYDALTGQERPVTSAAELSHFWQLRTVLRKRIDFGQTIEERGLRWFNHAMFFRARYADPISLALSFIATHNKIVLDDGRKVFNRSAPILKLKPNTPRSEALGLLGLLNSSTACFWLKQVCYPKGGDQTGSQGARIRRTTWDDRIEFDIAKLSSLPLPSERPTHLAELLQEKTEARSALLPEVLCATGIPTRARLDEARARATSLLGEMIALQEELDWLCYRLYGVNEESLLAPIDRVPPLELGQRAFEIHMARVMKQGKLSTTWFERHRSTPITEYPSHWPQAYVQVCAKRIEALQQNRDIGLVEQPEYKRRWNLTIWEEMEQSALREWLASRIEAHSIWNDHTLVSCGQLRDALAGDQDWISVAEICSGGQLESLDDFVTDLAVKDAVPFLPVLRYTEDGLRKRADWERVWDLQRSEDAGETVQITLPPKYRTNEFLKSDYWRLRGGLDVPKERFVLYPGLERDSDRTPLLGWAGWNHLQQAQALAGYYQRMRTQEGWEPERLKPVLAGLLDLKPWLLQWHNELDPETGVKLGEYFVQFAESQCQELGFSPEEVRAWQPAATTTSSARARRTNARRPQ